MAGGERVLTERDLNRALLARQLLLERAPLPIPRALERMGGLQAQYAPAMYVGLWTRLEGFERDALTRALERRSVIQATLMRATIHLVSRRDYWPFAVAIRDPRRRWWERVHPNRPRDMRPAAKRLRRYLGDGPRRRKEIEEFLGRERALGVGAYLDLVRVPPSGTWEQRRADLYAAAEDWVGPESVDAEEALTLLVRRYVAAFGPALKGDIADWAGVPVGEIDAALARLKLRRFRDEAGKELLDLPRAPLPDADTPAPPRFLPVWDATLLVHCRRTQIVPEEYRPLIFNVKTPHSANTFLIDGQVAGTWRYEQGRVKVEPFEGVPRKARRQLDQEAKRLAAFHG
ncbi:MAG TPA: winged helix DNA-binding domain-containing protein [Gaiellaceae bacterium]|nr:winged helix DNA-binding domain-containing protein [Gaiellaceae bacterium]